MQFRGPKAKTRDGLVRASDLASLDYCERRIVFDAARGVRTTPAQQLHRERGTRQHEKFLEEARAPATSAKPWCFIATTVLGECSETQALRRFRDRFMRRSVAGRWMVRRYYAAGPTMARWIGARPFLRKLARRTLVGLANLAVWLERS